MRRLLPIALILTSALAPWDLTNAIEKPAVVPDSLFHQSAPQEIREVIDRASFVDEKKGEVIRAHRQVYEYLLNHLDFASQLGQILDLTEYEIVQTGEGAYKATTPKGGWAYLEMVYTSDDKRVVLAQGKYARAVVVLQYTSFDQEGESYIVYDLYGYVRADNPILNFILSIFGGMIVNHRVESVLDSVAELNERIYDAPATFQHELLDRSDLRPKYLSEFTKILTQL